MLNTARLTSESKLEEEEWEDVRCPVCKEHPHNPVLLVCSSYETGCRPYLCDTSYQPSNCLDQFCKSFAEEEDDGKSVDAESIGSLHKLQEKLVCPLCFGQICGWVVVNSARVFMNAKTRKCACETCEFSGNYTDLRKHARLEHPQLRPDPEMGDQDDHPMDEREWLTTHYHFVRVGNFDAERATALDLDLDSGLDSDLDSSDGGRVTRRHHVRTYLSSLKAKEGDNDISFADIKKMMNYSVANTDDDDQCYNGSDEQFEQVAEEDDPFGLDQWLTNAKEYQSLGQNFYE